MLLGIKEGLSEGISNLVYLSRAYKMVKTEVLSNVVQFNLE